MIEDLPNEKGRSDRQEIDLYDMLSIGPAVHIIDHVFENDPKMIDRQCPGQTIQDWEDQKDQEQKIDAASIEASF